MDRAVGPGEVAGVDAVGRQGDVVVDRHVRRREPQFGTAPPVAPHHGTPHLVGPAQELGRPRHVPLRDEAADPGGGHGFGPVVGQPHADDLEAVLGAEAAQQLDVALAPVPEVEVLAHHHEAGPELVDQDLLDELLGRLVGPDLVEGHHQGAPDPALGQKLELLLERGQLLGGRVGPHHRRRVAVEGHHDGRETLGRGPVRQVAQAGPGAPDGLRRRRRSSRQFLVRASRLRVLAPSAASAFGPVRGAAGDDAGRRLERCVRARPQPAPASTTAGRMRSVPVASYTASSVPLSSSIAHGPSPSAPRGTRSSGEARADHRRDGRLDGHGVEVAHGLGRRQHRRGPDGVEGLHLGPAEGPDPGPAQVGHVCPTAKGEAEVLGQDPDVGARRTLDLGPVYQRSQRVGFDVEAVDRHRAGRPLHLNALAGQLVQATPAHLHRRDHRGHLVDVAGQRRRGVAHGIGRHVRHVEGGGDLARGVEREVAVPRTMSVV